jgi:hypothetical protein
MHNAETEPLPRMQTRNDKIETTCIVSILVKGFLRLPYSLGTSNVDPTRRLALRRPLILRMRSADVP